MSETTSMGRNGRRGVAEDIEKGYLSSVSAGEYWRNAYWGEDITESEGKTKCTKASLAP